MKTSSLLIVLTVLSTAYAGTHQENLAILKKVPVIKGFEKKSNDEDSIARKLHGIFSKIADESKNEDGSINRGTHAKGACFEGEVTVFTKGELLHHFNYSPEIVSRIKQGFFAIDGIYQTEVRFANAKGQRNPDTAKDVRAMAFAIDMGNVMKDYSGESRFDFMMNSSPMFAVNNIKEFYELMKGARLFMGDISYVLNPFYIKSTLRAKKLLEEYERDDIKSYATEEYWANLPYTHGLKNGKPLEVAKYKVTPCDGKGRQSELSKGKADDYLQQDILNRVQNNNVCFYLQVQLFDYNKIKNSLNGIHKNWPQVDWIENGGELWDEKVLPFHTIAKIEVPAALNAKKSSCKYRYINTRLHAPLEHIPMGSIARVRTYVEEKSRAKRMGEIK